MSGLADGPLTTRQWEVARLVAEGLGNREIAQRLHISDRTVETHVENVREKLGVDTRTQIAAWVAGQRGDRDSRPAVDTLVAALPPHNLRPHLTTFVGRERDLHVTRQLLHHGRLLTIVGPGGCGKTRLAVQLAAETLQQYPGGVWAINLGVMDDPETIPRAIAAALGVPEREGASPLDAIAVVLGRPARRSATLLLLDNCEHLTASCAETVVALLVASPSLKFLCTSREPLHVPGEVTWRIGPLSLPDSDVPPSAAAIQRSEAVRLFLDRASLADPEYTVDDTNAHHVADLCRRLDGMPLALELAAARVGLLSFDQILEHLEARISSLRPYGVPDRQQTVTATIDWSYELLSACERQTLRRLAVFRGGFTLEAADAVCRDPPLPGETLESLALLVDKSLVQSLPPDRSRHRCLELIRRYAWSRLAESGELDERMRRHSAYYLELAEQAAAELTGPGQPACLLRLSDEHHNLRAAMEHCRGDSGNRLLRFVHALYRFWFIRGHLSEGRAWAEAALATAGDTRSPLFAQVLSVAASLAWQQGDLVRARGWFEECLAVWRALGDSRGVQYSLGNLGLVAWRQGDWEAARALYERSLALAYEHGDDREVAIVLLNRALLAAYTGDLGNGLGSLREALRIMRSLGDQSLIATALTSLGDLELQAGSDVEAREHYEESLRLQRALGARRHVSDCLDGLASIAARQGKEERALRLAGAAAGIREAVGAAAEPWSRRLVEQWLEQARASLGAGGDRAWAEGRELPDHDAIALALEER